MKITINNEEVLCNKDFTINEEMLNTSSVILNNVYPKTWEQDKDYVSRFYYPKDYSKCKIYDEIEHPATREDVEGTSFSIEADTIKRYQVQTLKGQTTQTGTPTPSSPVPINITTGKQDVLISKNNLWHNQMEIAEYNSSGQKISTNVWLVNTEKIEVQPNTTYTISQVEHPIQYRVVYFNSNTYLSQVQNGTNTTTGYTSYTFTTPNNCNGIYIQFRSTIERIAKGSYNVQVGDITNAMLNKGNSALPYDTTTYEINLGKNLFNGTLYNTQVGSNGGITSSTTRVANVQVGGTSITYIPQGTYTLSIENLDYCSVLTKQGSTIIDNFATSWHSLPFTFTTTQGAYLYFTGRKSNNSTISPDDYSPQVEKGSSASSFSSYKTPIELCKIGNYQDYIFRNTTENPLYDSNLEEGQWYIHKEIGRVVLNGSENWNSSTANYYTIIDDIMLRSPGYSNYFVNSTTLGTFGYFRVSSTQHWLIFMAVSSQYTSQQWKDWLSTHNVEVYYVLNTPTNTLIEDEELINQLNSIRLLYGLNNVSITSPNLPFIMSLMYNYREAYTEEDLYFSGVVENTGNISLNPRHPHYCNLQVLDFKTFLSEGETLDFVIYNKTVLEAINQVIGTISDYGFVLGNVNILHGDDVIGAYSTKDKTAYDVFNYLADITQSRWTTRVLDENIVAIDFYDPSLMPQGTSIEYTQTWFTNHKIQDMSFSYSSRDYRNKQVMLSGEVYANVETTEIIVADGYQTQFNTTDKIGYVSSMLVNGSPVQVITKEEYELGYEGDFIYQPGNPYFESVDLISTGAIITIVYYAIIEGREVLLNQEEITRIGEMIARKGVIARYENRNDATTTGELQAIGQSYLKYKGSPEVILKVDSLENIWNVGERVEFNSPLEELTTEYMVKKKTTQYIPTQDNVFYTYELSSSFNSETEINYFDNQRSKMMGNIGVGEVVSRNIDIENTATIEFYNLEVEEVEITNNNTLQSELQGVLGGGN